MIHTSRSLGPYIEDHPDDAESLNKLYDTLLEINTVQTLITCYCRQGKILFGEQSINSIGWRLHVSILVTRIVFTYPILLKSFTHG